MDDGVYGVLAQNCAHARLVPGIRHDERRRRGHGPVEPGRKIVEHQHALAGVEERVHHVASDVTGSAGDQDRHVFLPCPL